MAGLSYSAHLSQKNSADELIEIHNVVIIQIVIKLNNFFIVFYLLLFVINL